MAERSSYNEHFAFADPGGVNSVSRSTLYRAKKRDRANQEQPEQDNPLSYQSECEQQLSSPHAQDDCHLGATEQQDICQSLDLAERADTDSLHILSAELENDTEDDQFFFEEDDESDKNDASTDNCAVSSSNGITQRDVSLYDGASLSKSTSSLIIMKFKMRHNLTDQCLADLLQLLRLMHCPTPNNCVSSLYYFKKNFVEKKFPINFHYFCSACFQAVSSCCINPLCTSTFEEIGSRSSFIEVPIEPQLQTLFKSKYIYLQDIGYVITPLHCPSQAKNSIQLCYHTLKGEAMIQEVILIFMMAYCISSSSRPFQSNYLTYH